ncbi:MAG TPA: penicillin acylase family protein, partial [Candidatus Polarisedimenticolia bacterium]|nr:penicillin acylase family protein [Candidatus Polarisedimenticolia bacterium]
YPDAGGGPRQASPGGERRVTGLTLPGTPAMVVGSNGRVAWGFTNSYGDWTDLVIVEPDPSDPNAYVTPDGPRPFATHHETLKVKGGADETVEVRWTRWGPVIDQDHAGRPRALRWIAHDERAVNLGLLRMEQAGDLDEAVVFAAGIGAPPQNIVIADSAGRIGWTIMGAIPRRVGFTGRLPVSWADGARGWDGWLSPEEYPRIVDPPGGRLWTANARVVDGPMLAVLGDGGYDLGARAGQIRDRLARLDRAVEADMLAIQLDDEAIFLQRWRALLLDAFDAAQAAADPRRTEARRYVEDWGGRASIDSVGYRIVRAFRSFAADQVLSALTARCRQADKRFNRFEARQYESALWRLLNEKPAHLLDPKHPDWDAQIEAVVGATLDYFFKDGQPLSDQTWGRRNLTRILHPISRGVPALGRWLDMPARPLPGDSYMPRVQAPSAGASQRMAVSPGRESSGYMHMPCGQSGHPLSPHYRDAHTDWAEGRPTPFLPGPPVHSLLLRPK